MTAPEEVRTPAPEESPFVQRSNSPDRMAAINVVEHPTLWDDEEAM